MDLGLTGRRALVMGASRGLGKAIAAALVAEGARVAVCARDAARIAAVAAELGAEGLVCDLSVEGAASAVVAEAERRLGGLDILVVNTGGPPAATFESITDAGWRGAFEGLWMSAVGAIRAALPGMRRRRHGRIIVITSIAAKEPVPNLMLSNSLRAGLHGLINALSKEVAGDQITVNALMPGYRAYGIMEFHNDHWGLGFGQRGYPWYPLHTPARGIIQTGDNLNALNRYLFEGPLPGLAMVLMLFLTFTQDPADYLLLASFAALPALYFFYWYQDLCLGPRFLYEGLAPLLLLSARGLVRFPRFVGIIAGAHTEVATRGVLMTGFALSLCFAALIGIPKLVKVYHASYWDVDNRIQTWVAQNHVNNAVVFIGPPGSMLYGAGYLENTLDFRGPVVYAIDRGDEDYLLMCRFPGRAYYRATRDTFYRIDNPDSPKNSPASQALAEAGRYVGGLSVSGYSTIIMPYREAGALIDTTGRHCRTFRELGYALFRDPSALTHCTPATAVFLTGDRRNYVPEFESMREGGDYVAAGCRFTLLLRSANGQAVVYDIQPADDRSIHRLAQQNRLALEHREGQTQGHRGEDQRRRNRVNDMSGDD